MPETNSGAAPKLFRRGTHRVVAPAETVSKALAHASAIGITRIANITGLDALGIPVWTACRPNARSLSVSQGKGLDDDAAKASAIMESIEAFHAERIALPLKFASYDEMRAQHVVANVEELCRTARPLATALPIFWIEAQDLSTEQGVWVPFELVHLNYTLPPLPGSGLFVASSNGLASGNHPLEAISHGLCEVIERDAVTLWRLGGEPELERSRIALSSIDDDNARSLLERYERAGIAVAVWDATSDIGIPCFSCSIAERNATPLRPMTVARGMGCHPSREIALLRALTEAAQSRLTVISGARDDLSDTRFAVNEGDAERARTARLISNDVGQRDFRAAATHESRNVEDDVATELECLRRAGKREVLVVDLTLPQFDIPVFRVIVPGLEALYDAPGYSPGPRARRLLESQALGSES